MGLAHSILSWIGHAIYDFQSLIAGLMAVGVAWVALRPVYRQLHLAQIQMAIGSREVLLDRIEALERRSRESAAELSTITSKFLAELFLYSESEDEPNINSPWAHQAEQIVARVISGLKHQQTSKADNQIIDDRRTAVILAAEALENCLRDIHQPDSIDLDEPEYGFTAEQIAVEKQELDKASRVASESLVSRITTVSTAAKSLDTEYLSALAALRERLRQVNDLILREDHTGK